MFKILSSFLVPKVYAATIVGPSTTVTTLADIINPALKIFYGVVGVAVFGMFLYGGITWLTSAGDADKVKKAQDTMLNAVIGLVIVIFAFFLTRLVGTILGFKLI